MPNTPSLHLCLSLHMGCFKGIKVVTDTFKSVEHLVWLPEILMLGPIMSKKCDGLVSTPEQMHLMFTCVLRLWIGLN